MVTSKKSPPVCTTSRTGQDSGAACEGHLFCSSDRASVFAFSDSSRDFCKKSLLAVMTGNFKNALSLSWADVYVANYSVMHNTYDGEIIPLRYYKILICSRNQLCDSSAFYVNMMICFVPQTVHIRM